MTKKLVLAILMWTIILWECFSLADSKPEWDFEANIQTEWSWENHWSASNDDLSISVNNKTPDINERIKLTINTDNDYTGKIKFNKVQYRKDIDGSRTTISSRTSSTYFSDYSTARSDGYYKMTSSDDWKATISKFLKFKKEWYYRIYAEDTYWESDYIIIEVWQNKDNEDYSIQLSTNRKSPASNQYIDLTIETEDEDYVWKLTFSAKYKNSSSTSWTNISNLTSSTYFNDYSSSREDWYYKMKSSDEWKITLKNLIKFKKEWYYRIYVKDIDDNEAYIQFAVNIEKEDEEIDEDDEEDIIEKEIYISRSWKPYVIEYNSILKVFTSESLKSPEYFINSEYFKRYIDSKNPQKIWAPVNSGRITISYVDKSNDEDRYVAPNGKVYYITTKNWYYSSKQITSWKKFPSVNELKYYIRDHNPLIWM